MTGHKKAFDQIMSRGHAVFVPRNGHISICAAAALCIFMLPTAASPVQEDPHFLQADDFFFAEKPRGDHPWVFVFLGKVLTPSSPESKGRAELLRVTDGRKIWTSLYWKTRPATPADLKLGAEIIVFDREDKGVYRAPRNKEEARRSSWYMAVVTDVSELGQGFVTVSGGYRIQANGVRIIDQK